MIFLKSQNIIFLKAKKIAGTSVEIALSANANAQDIVTPFSMYDECVRYDLGFQTPVNWAVNHEKEERHLQRIKRFHKLYHTPFLPYFEVYWTLRRRLGFSPIAHKSRGDKDSTVFYAHMTADDIARQLGRDVFLNAYKVAVVRHPYDQLISHVYFRLRKTLELNFLRRADERAFNNTVDRILREELSISDHYMFENQWIVDHPIRYEHLREDLKILEDSKGLKLVQHLPHTKHTFRKDRRPAHEVLTKDQMRRCFEKSRIEFEMFGYESYL